MDETNSTPVATTETSSLIASDKVDGTNMGFKPVMVLSSKDTETTVDPTCKMDRPSK